MSWRRPARRGLSAPPYGVEGWQRHEADGDQPIGRQHEPYRWSGLSALGTSGGRRRAHVEDTAVVPEAARRLDLAERPQGWQCRGNSFFHVRYFGTGGIEEVEPKDVGRNNAHFTRFFAGLAWENTQHRLVAPRLSRL